MEIKSTLSYEDWRNKLKKTAAIVAGSLALTGSLVACESNSEVEAKPNAPASQSDGGGAEIASSDGGDAEEAPSDSDGTETLPPDNDSEVTTPEASTPESLPSDDDEQSVENEPNPIDTEIDSTGGPDLTPEELAELKANSYGGSYPEDGAGLYIPYEQDFGAIDAESLSDEKLMELDEQGVCLQYFYNCTVDQFGEQMPEKLQKRFNAMGDWEKQYLIDQLENNPKAPNIESELQTIESITIVDADNGLPMYAQFLYPKQCMSMNVDNPGPMITNGECQYYDPAEVVDGTIIAPVTANR